MLNRNLPSHTRILKDSVQDTILLLYLLRESHGSIKEQNLFDAKIRLMKLVFLAEKEMVERRLKGFNFFFNIYKHGPSSWEILCLLDDLSAAGLIKLEDKEIRLTSFGEKLVGDFVDSQRPEQRKNNTKFLSTVKNVVERNRDLNLKELLDKTYKIKMTPFGTKRSVEIGRAVEQFRKAPGKPKPRLLMRLPKKHVASELEVSEDWVQTFAVVCNPDFEDFLKHAAT
jgi:uncharacterized protein YwgA